MKIIVMLLQDIILNMFGGIAITYTHLLFVPSYGDITALDSFIHVECLNTGGGC